MDMGCIGTSGWRYSDWNRLFYPEHVKGGDQLSYYARHFNTVEVNSTFYHMPRVSTVQAWYNTVPDDFIFSIKLNRYFTHTKRLIIDEAFQVKLTQFLTSVLELKDKLGIMLVQLPPSLQKDTAKLEAFLHLIKQFKRQFESRLPLALEFRHASWFTPEVNELLDEFGAANVINDSPGTWPEQREITGRTLYIRFHGHTELFRSSYSDEQLASWAAFIFKHQDQFDNCYIFFNNCYDTVGVQNARTLYAMLESALTHNRSMR